MNYSEEELNSMILLNEYLLKNFKGIESIVDLILFIQILAEYISVKFPTLNNGKYMTGKESVKNNSGSVIMYNICLMRNILVHWRGYSKSVEQLINGIMLSKEDVMYESVREYINILLDCDSLFEQLKDVLKSCTYSASTHTLSKSLTPILSSMLKGD